MAKPKPKFPDYQKCMFCPRRAWGGRLGSWLVSDERWTAAGFKPTDVACRKCLEKRDRLRTYVADMSNITGWFQEGDQGASA